MTKQQYCPCKENVLSMQRKPAFVFIFGIWFNSFCFQWKEEIIKVLNNLLTFKEKEKTCVFFKHCYSLGITVSAMQNSPPIKAIYILFIYTPGSLWHCCRKEKGSWDNQYSMSWDFSFCLPSVEDKWLEIFHAIKIFGILITEFRDHMI